MDDQDGNKVQTKDYNAATYYFIGNGLQDYTGGLRSDLRYKRFDFSVLASFGIGGDFYDGNYQALMGGIRATGNNASVDLLNSRSSTAYDGDGHTHILRNQLYYGSHTSTWLQSLHTTI